MCSSWIGRETYHGYYADWITQAAVGIPYALIVTTIGSFYVGIYLYINGMVEDLEETLTRIDYYNENFNWPTYVEVIHLHNTIIE